MYSARYLSKEVRQTRLHFRSVLYGVSVEEPRWQQCLLIIKDKLGMATGKLYVDTYFEEMDKQIANDMISDIRAAFKEIVDGVSWMDEETKEKTKEKVRPNVLAQAISKKIGFPDFILDAAKLDGYYEDLTFPVNMSSYVTDVITLWRFTSKSDLRKLHNLVDKADWFTTPPVVNAAYSSIQNSIVFPAAILQPPFFSSESLKALNYGAIGSLIGHEITHGFDDQGRQTDKDGNMASWWSEQVIENFVEHTRCIIEQYSSYSELVLGETIHLNGINTQGENIADNGGVKESYKAYRKWVEENGEEAKLPGLENFSPDQLFFLNFANVWCGFNREEYLRVHILTGVHSPGKYRVIGVVSNSEDFSRIFNCPAGSPMNPPNKCSVW